jgi:hypothetical protein
VNLDSSQEGCTLGYVIEYDWCVLDDDDLDDYSIPGYNLLYIVGVLVGILLIFGFGKKSRVRLS